MRPRPEVLASVVSTTTAVLSDDLKKYVDEERVYATVATVGKDGQPHLTVVWITRDGDDLVFSTTVDRVQGRNIRRDPRVTVMIHPPERPFVYAEIKGSATVTPDPERALPDELSLKYTGKLYRDFNPAWVNDGERIIVRVTPHKVTGRL
ncbi:PPOX class F420-dependent oxidoreductase [Nocardia cyriacigeorgica]|nr:PPOX class F420-dependent oxidoreductase [Nocardia cyriacigeorgica]MBF6395989.1 PPOX class F420-dependent oxidoreductase [Nocardia cyriacigeorgica]MBF6401621.1 PPOX class F420-dependent oxidoreductase [Nocardia cyriacigeorgica]